MPEDQRGGWFRKAAISLVAVVTTAYLSFIYGQKISRDEMLADQRVAAYIQYVQATAMLSKLSDKDDSSQIAQQEALRNSARFRAAIYGSSSVLKAWESVVNTEKGTKEWETATVKWFQAMRYEIVLEKDRVNDKTIHTLLFHENL